MQSVFSVPRRVPARQNVLLRDYTTFRIGGPAKYFFEPRTLEDLRLTFAAMRERGDMPYYILGGGSKLLISDDGVDGAVISMRRFEDHYIARFGNLIRVSAGVRLQRLVKATAAWGLCGLEDLAGIPGTVGGAIKMNAGTRDRSIGDRISHVEVMDSEGTVERVPSPELGLGYRTSNLGGRVVIFIELELRSAMPEEIRERFIQAFTKKKQTQPLSLYSAGCFFKNPATDSAGRMVDLAGLKGVENGRAAVSKKHANFIVNRGGATASDVLNLVKVIRQLVKSHFGVELESEVCVWP
jgi:UDP-N-acetylmuramate dehydrogenase